jgi:hypothetical protein
VGDERGRGPGPQRRVGEVGADEVRSHRVGDRAELAVVGGEGRLVGGVEPEQAEGVRVLAGDPEERARRLPPPGLAGRPVRRFASSSPGVDGGPVRLVTDDGVELRAEPRRHLLEDGPVELLLRREDAVHDEPGDAGRAGHVVHGGAVEAGADERRRRGPQDLGAALGPRESAGRR